MRNLTRGEAIGLIVLLTALTGMVGVGIARMMLATGKPGITVQEAFPQPPAAAPVVRPNEAPVVSTPPPASEIVVHVAGAVKKPGVYRLSPDARNDDALKAAGGPTENADTDRINLAARAEDGSQLYVPTKQEASGGGAETGSAVTNAANKSGSKSGAAHPNAAGEGSGKPEKLKTPGEGTVNINTAGAEELQRLPGIGPAMAERILSFRKENGSFQAPEDLMNVTGIGEKKFAKMQPFVKVR